MTGTDLIELLKDFPVIAAVKDASGLKNCLRSESQAVFVLYGDLVTIPEIVRELHSAGKTVFLHADLVEGLSTKEIAVDFLKQYTRTDGMISTRPGLVRRAKQLGLLTVQRFFLLDSIALENVSRQMALGSADLYEVLPGLMPKIIRKLSREAPAPLIAGGLITDKEDVVTALSAGALGISSTNPEVWFM